MCDDYKRYVCSKYGECIVVSDVYTDGPTVKDMTHQRRGQTNYVQILEAMGCQVIHATGDAAFLIAQTAADNMTVVVVADDTDVLILLCYHYRHECQTLYFKPEA